MTIPPLNKWTVLAVIAAALAGSTAAIGLVFWEKPPAPKEAVRVLPTQQDWRQSRLESIPAPVPTDEPSHAEGIEVDVSARMVAITSAFKGTEIVVFGAVRGSRQESAESGLYDIAIVVEGAMAPMIVRKKSNVGIWINTEKIRFASLPAYYAVTSTRPLEEITTPKQLAEARIGFSNIPMNVAGGDSRGLSEKEIADYKTAVIRLKSGEGLYQAREYAVAFIGRSLFRSTVRLPANIPVGTVKATAHLFRDGRLLSSQEARVVLQREGVERLMFTFADRYPFWYGVFAVLLAVSAGLLASRLFQRKA